MKLRSKYHRLIPETRLYGTKVPLIGLTGGIATGKSTVSGLLEKKGVPVINADQLVKNIYASEEAKTFVRDRWPDVFISGSIHFPTLREKFFKDAQIKNEIETFIYQRLPRAFQDAQKKWKAPSLIVYDVPLLFEKKMSSLFDMTVLVYAPRPIQRARLMVRDGLLEPMADTILNQQIDIEEKKEKADFIIDNSRGEAELELEVAQFLRLATD